mgnify:CR=1 FL=1
MKRKTRKRLAKEAAIARKEARGDFRFVPSSPPPLQHADRSPTVTSKTRKRASLPRRPCRSRRFPRSTSTTTGTRPRRMLAAVTRARCTVGETCTPQTAGTAGRRLAAKPARHTRRQVSRETATRIKPRRTRSRRTTMPSRSPRTTASPSTPRRWATRAAPMAAAPLPRTTGTRVASPPPSLLRRPNSAISPRTRPCTAPCRTDRAPRPPRRPTRALTLGATTTSIGRTRRRRHTTEEVDRTSTIRPGTTRFAGAR